jgi:ferredoxin-type protein NapH
MGATYALLGGAALLRVSAERRAACDDCMDCYTVCPEPQVIRPALKGNGSPLIRASECTNCGRCIEVCSLDVFRFTTRLSASTDRRTP